MTDELDGADIFQNWDQLIQDPQASTPPVVKEELDFDALMGSDDQRGEDYWENLFQESNFAGMNLMGGAYYPITIHEVDFFKKYESVKRLFISDVLSNNLNDLRVAGLSEESIFYLSKGILPSNWTVHLKYPPLYGGLIEPDNMVMIQCHPFHELIHDFINKQILTMAGVGHPKVLYVPTPTGKVYIPEGGWEGSGGKKKADRSVMAGMTQSALQKLTSGRAGGM